MSARDVALKLALEALEGSIALTMAKIALRNKAITKLKEALAQPAPPPECKTEAEQTAYAFGWWKALESVRTEQPAQEPVAQWQKRHHLWTEGAWENAEEHDAKRWRDKAQGWEIRALYTAPPKRQPLTPGTIRNMYARHCDPVELVRAVEKLHGVGA